MLSKEEFDPETQFYCYLCLRIKDKATHTPTFFRVGGHLWVGCPDCVKRIEEMRTFEKGEKHPVLVNGSWEIVEEQGKWWKNY